MCITSDAEANGEEYWKQIQKGTNEKTTIAQIPKKTASDSESINQCFSATAIANVKKPEREKKSLLYIFLFS